MTSYDFTAEKKQRSSINIILPFEMNEAIKAEEKVAAEAAKALQSVHIMDKYTVVSNLKRMPTTNYEMQSSIQRLHKIGDINGLQILG